MQRRVQTPAGARGGRGSGSARAARESLSGLLALQRSVGNRTVGALVQRQRSGQTGDEHQAPSDAPRTLAHDAEADQVASEANNHTLIKQLAQKAQALSGESRGWMAQSIISILIQNYVPESQGKIPGWDYDAKAKGFSLKGARLVAGDDMLDRAAAGRVDELIAELRSAAGQLATADFAAHRPSTIWIGGERVIVSSPAEQRDAERIVKELKNKYGVVLDSIAARRTTRAEYAKRDGLSDDQLKGVDTAPWEYKELVALELAMKHFAAILGDARRKSGRASSPQEIDVFGKLNKAPDDDPKHPESRSEGEHFSNRTAVLYPSDHDLSDADPTFLERHATHELAHGVFAPQLRDFMKVSGYWSEKYVKSGTRDAEAPPTSYGRQNAGEDLAESVSWYFIDGELLRKGGRSKGGYDISACPKRYALIRQIVRGWTPSK